MKHQNEIRPDLPAMAIVLTATLLFGGILFLMLGSLISNDPAFGFLSERATAVSGVITVVFVCGIAIRIGRSPSYRTFRVVSERIFHIWQGVVLGVIALGAYLMGTGDSPAAVWAGAGAECVMVTFYVCYIGYGMALRQKLPQSAYTGAIFVLVSAVYAIWRAPK